MLEPVKEYIEQHKPFIDKAIYATTEHIFPFLVTLFSASYSWSKGVLLNKMVIFEDISVIFSTLTTIAGFIYMCLRIYKFMKDESNS
jgi:hypothetical protein